MVWNAASWLILTVTLLVIGISMHVRYRKTRYLEDFLLFIAVYWAAVATFTPVVSNFTGIEKPELVLGYIVIGVLFLLIVVGLILNIASRYSRRWRFKVLIKRQ